MNTTTTQETSAVITAAQLQESTSIANRAMKFKLSRGGTSKRIRDRDAEDQLAQATGEDGWLASRPIFKDKASPVYAYQTLANEMYGYHIKATLPFGEDGTRILPNASYFDYTTTMQGYISQLDLRKQQIINSWDVLVQADIATRNAAKAAAGKAQDAHITDYPSVSQMEASLYITWYPEAISTSNDFRFQVPADMLARVDAQIEAMVADAGRDLYVRMLKPVTAFVEKLSKYTGEKGTRMGSSFIDNLNALTSEIPRLNINGDPVVSSLLAQIDAIVKPYTFHPDALKEDPIARMTMKSKLEALEQTLKGYTL